MIIVYNLRLLFIVYDCGLYILLTVYKLSSRVLGQRQHADFGDWHQVGPVEALGPSA